MERATRKRTPATHHDEPSRARVAAPTPAPAPASADLGYTPFAATTEPAQTAAILRLPQPQRPAALLALQRTVGNGNVRRLIGGVIQRANPADARLPADQKEALTRAKEAKASIDTAIAAMKTSPLPERRNAVEFMTQKKWTPAALTPRHDSKVGDPIIHFFPGQNDYTGSQKLAADTTHKVSPKRTWVYVRARTHGNIDAALPQAEIEQRIAAAVSEIAFTKSATSKTPNNFQFYRARFNGLFVVPPFNGLSAAPDLSMNAHGPKTPRARAIFDRIMSEEPKIKADYDKNAGGFKEQIDAYAVPDGFNQVDSPRLQKLREAFFPFTTPVPDAQFPKFKKAIEKASAPLDSTDRDAVDRSNDWQKLINAHVTDEAKRQEIRNAIAGPSAAPGPTPNRAAFLAKWQMKARFNAGTEFQDLTSGATITYRNGTQQLAAKGVLPPPDKNTGLVFFLRLVVNRGAVVAGTSKIAPFPPRGDEQQVRAGIAQPVPVPAAGDNLTFKLELLEADQSTVADSKSLSFVAKAGGTFDKAKAIAAATEDDAHFKNTSPSGLLGKMAKRGGHAARVAEAIKGGAIKLEPLTARHDSQTFQAAVDGGADPQRVGYFHGLTYDDTPPDTAHSTTRSATVVGTTVAHGLIFVKRTVDVATNAKAQDDGDNGVIDVVIHEAIHALDAPVHKAGSTDLDHYKSEFRAYWMSGEFGPADQATCAPGASGCKPTAVDPSMPAPGPKSPRARAIFDHLYRTYNYVKPAYDNNTDGFRDEVDRYVWPDGINLIVSLRLDTLQKLIDGWDGTNFSAFRAEVLRFTGTGAPPPGGVLKPEDRKEISNNRAWRDLVDDKVKQPAENAQIKGDLGIPG